MFIIGVKRNKQNQLANVILSKDVCAILQNSHIYDVFLTWFTFTFLGKGDFLYFYLFWGVLLATLESQWVNEWNNPNNLAQAELAIMVYLLAMGFR